MSVARKAVDLQLAIAFQWLPPRVVEAHQLRKLRRMLAFCERHVPLYRETFKKAGVSSRDLRRVEDLASFPFCTRDMVTAAYPDGLLHRKSRPGDLVFRTSGTSGVFMEIAYSARAHDYLDAVYMRSLFSTGYRPWHRLAYGWWEDKPKPKTGYERLGLGTKHFIPVDPDPRVQLAALRASRADYVYHFPSSMMMMGKLVEKEGMGDLRLRGVICHGEFMAPAIQAELSRIFRCPVWNQYGAQEFNRLGSDCDRHEGLHLAADTVVVEVVSGERVLPDGEEGELVFTGIENDLMPLVRYRLGDAGRKIPGRCACGRGLPRFEVTEGRMDDVLTLPDGRRVGPRSLAPRIEDVDGFTQYRVIHKRPEHVEVQLVLAPGAPANVQEQVAEAVRRVLGEAISVEVRPVASIALSRRGKLRKVVSEIRADGRKGGDGHEDPLR